MQHVFKQMSVATLSVMVTILLQIIQVTIYTVIVLTAMLAVCGGSICHAQNYAQVLNLL